MSSGLTIIPNITIHPAQILTWNEYHFAKPRARHKYLSTSEEEVLAAPEKFIKSSRKANYLVSKNAKKKLNRAIDYLLLMSNQKTFKEIYTGRSQQFRVAFITLTLPSNQIHSDNEIKNKCLNSFLIELKKVYKVRNYVWRSEKQGNGNIHFHILVGKFIPHQELKDRWNRIVNKLGYVDRYRESQKNWHRKGFRVRKRLIQTWPESKQKEAYIRGSKYQWNSPNSTDIHSIKKIHNIKNYISKYITKNEDKYLRYIRTNLVLENKLKVENVADNKNKLCFKKRSLSLKIRRLKKKYSNSGRIWGCNTQLSNISGARTVLDTPISSELEYIDNTFHPNSFSDTYFSITYIDFAMLNSGRTPVLLRLFSLYLFRQFNFSLQSELAA